MDNNKNYPSCNVGARTTQFRDNRGVSHNYLFSWENGPTSNLNLDWDGAQKICREHCMDLVSIETGGENDFIKVRLELIIRICKKYISKIIQTKSS